MFTNLQVAIILFVPFGILAVANFGIIRRNAKQEAANEYQTMLKVGVNR